MSRVAPERETPAVDSDVSPMDMSDLLGTDGNAKIFDVDSGRVIDGASMRDTYFARARQRSQTVHDAANGPGERRRQWWRMAAIVAICMAGPPAGAGIFLVVSNSSPKPVAPVAYKPPANDAVDPARWETASPLGAKTVRPFDLPSIEPKASEALTITPEAPTAVPALPVDTTVFAALPPPPAADPGAAPAAPALRLNVVTAPPPSVPVFCPAATIDVSAMPGGLSKFKLVSPCRKGQTVTLAYAGFHNPGRLDDHGTREFIVDLFAGDQTTVGFVFEDGTRTARLPIANDLNLVSKVAIIWSEPINLDLHAFEYSARIGGKGHVWAGSPSSVELARTGLKLQRGKGFLSSQSSGAEDGMHVEVYTFVNAGAQRTGSIETAIHYATRGAIPQGDTCGGGQHANVTFDVFLLSAGQLVEKVTRQFSSVPCGVALSADRLLVRNSVYRLDKRQAALRLER